jgi:hypothetical protein
VVPLDARPYEEEEGVVEAGLLVELGCNKKMSLLLGCSWIYGC